MAWPIDPDITEFNPPELISWMHCWLNSLQKLPRDRRDYYATIVLDIFEANYPELIS